MMVVEQLRALQRIREIEKADFLRGLFDTRSDFMKITEAEYLENRRESCGWHPTQQGLVNLIKVILVIGALAVIRLILMF